MRTGSFMSLTNRKKINHPRPCLNSLFLSRLFRTVWNPTCPEAGCCGTLSLVDFTHSPSSRLTLHSSPFTMLSWVSCKSFFFSFFFAQTVVSGINLFTTVTGEFSFELSSSFSWKAHRQPVSAPASRRASNFSYICLGGRVRRELHPEL